MIGELDLQIVHALQEAPRAPWSVIADVLESDTRTVSRRYDQLVDQGQLRVMATPGPVFLGRIHWALLRAETLPGQAELVARQLARSPQIPTIRVTDGDSSIFALLSGHDTRSVWRATQDEVARIPQIVTTRVYNVLRSLDVGRSQRLDSLSNAQIGRLRSHRPPDRFAAREPVTLSPHDASLLNLLTADGRMDVAAIADRLDRSRSTVSRRIARLQADGMIDFIALLTDASSSRPVTVLIWCNIEPAEWDQLATRVAPLAWVGLLTITTGRSNVFLVAHLATTTSVEDVLCVLKSHCPSTQIHETQLSIHAVKVHIRILDEHERWTDDVPQPYAEDNPLLHG